MKSRKKGWLHAKQAERGTVLEILDSAGLKGNGVKVQIDGGGISKALNYMWEKAEVEG